MNLFIVRHAIALPAQPGQDDESRELSPEGEKRFRRVVRGLAALGVDLDLLVHSPLRRAVQTAQLMRPILSGERMESPLLAREPGMKLTRSLFEMGRDSIGAVGHEPWLSMWLADLLVPGGMRPETVEFKKGGVAWLEGNEPGRIKLRAFLPPRVLRQVEA